MSSIVLPEKFGLATLLLVHWFASSVDHDAVRSAAWYSSISAGICGHWVSACIISEVSVLTLIDGEKHCYQPQLLRLIFLVASRTDVNLEGGASVRFNRLACLALLHRHLERPRKGRGVSGGSKSGGAPDSLGGRRGRLQLRVGQSCSAEPSMNPGYCSVEYIQ